MIVFDWLTDLRTASFRPRVRRTVRHGVIASLVRGLETRRLLSAQPLEVSAASLPGATRYDAPVIDDFFPPEQPAAQAADTPALGPFPDGDTFLLHSRPNATKRIYLDFNGHTTTGKQWNTQYGNRPTIVSPAFDFEGGEGTFTSNELGRIQQIWQRVQEAFSPFDVDVTTQEPPLDDLRNTGGGDTRWGIRVIIGGDSQTTFGIGAGGVAYVGSFDGSVDIGCFVFPDSLGDSEKNIADATAHEVGHTLGLSHDGVTGGTEYYRGHGSGATGWAPIMGVGYDRQLVQWSKGEYPNPTNTQDDLQIIVTQNGFGYRPDDHGNNAVSATAISTGSGTITGAGVIETRSDVDWFVIDAAGTGSLQINPYVRGAMLDITASLYNSSQQLIATSNPTDALNASFTLASAGTYYVSIDGAGKAANGTDYGYTDYASIGQYTLSGTVTAGGDPNDQISEAFVVTSASVSARIDPNTDVDMFRITAAAGDQWRVDLDLPTAGLDSYLRVFNASGQQLAANDDGPTPGESSSRESYIDITFSTAGFYYFGVSGFNNSTYDALTGNGDTASNTIGDYVLNFALVPPPNQPPVVNNQTFSIAENLANVSVGTVAATDPNAGQTLQYAITGGNTGGRFTINSATGELRVGGTPLDFETQSQYQLTVQVTDNGNPALSDTAVITVNVTDQPEGDPNDQISEAINVTGASMSGLIDSNTDVDMYRLNVTAANDRWQLDLDRPTGGLLNSYLRVFNAAGQQLALNDDGPTPGESVSNESYVDVTFTTAGMYYIGVSGFGNSGYDPLTGNGDTGGSTGDYILNFTRVVAGNQPPVINPQTFALAENRSVGTIVGTVLATDPNAGQTLTYAITAGNINTVFAINSTTGQITVAKATIDFETLNQYRLTVQVTDNGSPTLSSSATVTVNITNLNEPPVFQAPTTFTVPAGSPNGTVVGTVRTVDPEGNAVSYLITGGNTNNAFAINATSGQITVANSSALNIGTTPQFLLSVKATDNGSPSNNRTQTITINLTSVANQPPNFTGPTSFTIPENRRNGTLVGTVTAVDPEGTAVAYAITAGNINNAFAINASTGQITVANRFAVDFETTPRFQLSVRATDSGNPAASRTQTITINLTNTIGRVLNRRAVAAGMLPTLPTTNTSGQQSVASSSIVAAPSRTSTPTVKFKLTIDDAPAAAARAVIAFALKDE